MGESENRAVAAGSTITVQGKEYTLRPITVQHLCDLEREALKFYKRQYLETFTENADLVGGDITKLIERKLDEMAEWTLDDLPKKVAFSVSNVPVTAKLKKWATNYRAKAGGEEDTNITDRKVRVLLTTALDRGELSPEKVKEMTGRRPVEGRVRYDQWWVTGCIEGMVLFIHSSIKHDHPEISKEDIRNWPISAIFEAARVAEGVTAPDLGNG